MFTGIIEELGTISSIEQNDDGARFFVSATTVVEDSDEGDSIAVNGVCLTALEISDSGFEADVSIETLERSSLGSIMKGSVVNLERAVTPSTRLGGHIVQGHVDGTGVFAAAEDDGDFSTVTVGFPSELGRYLVFKGSITVDGISLTIAALREGEFDIAVIPKTLELTNLSSLEPGDVVNLEVDLIAKYVERLLLYRKDGGHDESEITMDKLKSLGFA